MNLDLDNFKYNTRHYVGLCSKPITYIEYEYNVWECREEAIKYSTKGDKACIVCLRYRTDLYLDYIDVPEKYLAIPALLVGVLDVLFYHEEECVKPILTYKPITPQQYVLTYSGWKSWTQHPAIASYLLHHIRIAQSLMTSPLRDEFLSYFEDEGHGAIKAVEENDKDYFLAVLEVLKTKFTGWWINWSQMPGDEVYWQIIDKLLNYKDAYTVGTSYSGFRECNGAVDWDYNQEESIITDWIDQYGDMSIDYENYEEEN